MNISAVILAKNEEKQIGNCLASLTWCDEVIVIDDYSQDKTEEIAKKYKAKVFKRLLADDFAQQRNFGLTKANSDWILFVDADEQVSSSLKNEIEHVVEKEENIGYFIPRRDFMWGKRLMHGEQGNMKLLRLAKKSTGKWRGEVHEIWDVRGSLGTLKNPLLHFPHPTLSEFLTEINKYSTLRANQLQKEGEKAGFFSVLFYPKAKFIQNYFFKLGFLDGIEGFIAALLMSFHSFLVRGKLWQLTEK